MVYQVSVGGRMSSYSNLSDFEWKISRWYVGTWIGTGFQASNITAPYNLKYVAFDPALGFPGGSDGKESACSVGDLSSIPGSGRSAGGKKWQSAPVFLPREVHGQRSLVGYGPWGHKEWDTTEQLTLSLFTLLIQKALHRITYTVLLVKVNK